MRRLYNPVSIPVIFRIRLIGILGFLFCFTGAAAIIFSVVELFNGRANIYHYDESQGGINVSNPLWPSAGKGFWVGLILIVTGLVGILASCEWTPPSIVAFTALASVSTILSFYMMITCIIPIYYDAKYSDLSRPPWQLTELTINSLLIVVGTFGCILGAITSLIGCCFAGCCTNQRDNRYSLEPDRIVIVTPQKFHLGTPNIQRRELYY